AGFLQCGWMILIFTARNRIRLQEPKQDPMRLDKYLKVSRLVKRRTVAAELCQGGHVRINGKTAKPSAELKPGDVLQVRFGNRLLTAEVLRVPEKAVPVQEATSLYNLLDERPLESPL